LASGIARLAAKAVSLEKLKMLALLGITEQSNNIREGAFAAPLVADNGDEVGVELNVAAVKPVARGSRAVDLGDPK
jgi:hypothetical protein